MRVRLFPYNQSSESCSLLNSYLGSELRQSSNEHSVRPSRIQNQDVYVLRLRREGSNFRPQPNDLIINWGNGGGAVLEQGSRVLNAPDAVNKAANKLTFFRSISDFNSSAQDNEKVNVPEWTTEQDQVRSWLADGRTAFARTTLRGNSGRGIVDIQNEEQLSDIPAGTLFPKYTPKKWEFRVHVFRGEAFATHRKALRRDRGTTIGYTPNWRIRSYDNGFIFERHIEFEVPASVAEQARRAVAALGLDFGACDVIYNQIRDKSYVLEVNTAPGIEGETVLDYALVFTNYVKTLG